MKLISAALYSELYKQMGKKTTSACRKLKKIYHLKLKSEIDKQLEETRANLVIYQYQRQMMLEKMDTVLTECRT